MTKSRISFAITLLALSALALAGCVRQEWHLPLDPAARPADVVAADPSGSYYDWRKTMQPERPYFHKYDQTLVMKIFLAEKSGNGSSCKVHLTFEQALDVIKRLDVITCGAPKIIYLVGWQYNGHDSKYPAWAEVNERLKRAGDPTAVESLRWLMREGRKYNTTVSLHINMLDAFPNSPLWDEYLTKDIIAKDKNGQPLKGEIYGASPSEYEQNYQLSYAKEWETGCAKRRIDGLLKMLPELLEAHTLHIDAFHNYPPIPHAYPRGKYPDRDWNFKGISPYLGYGMEKECAAMRKTFRYFRDCGIDITSEGCTFLRSDPFIGLQPMAWAHDFRFPVPPKMLTYTPMRAEPEIRADPVNLSGLLGKFALDAAPWLWENGLRRDDETKKPQPSDWNRIRQGNDICIPMLWKSEPTLLSYSRAGCTAKIWELPAEWKNVKTAILNRIRSDGSGTDAAGMIAINDGKISLTLTAGEAVAITPAAKAIRPNTHY